MLIEESTQTLDESAGRAARRDRPVMRGRQRACRTRLTEEASRDLLQPVVPRTLGRRAEFLDERTQLRLAPVVTGCALGELGLVDPRTFEERACRSPVVTG